MEVQRLSRFLLGILLFSIVGCTAVQEFEEPVVTTTPMVDKLKEQIKELEVKLENCEPKDEI